MNRVTLTLKCPDRPGLIASITEFVFENGGNIINLDQHTDTELLMFFMRIEWDFSKFQIPKSKLEKKLQDFLSYKNIANAEYKLVFSEQKPRLALFVSRHDHCFWDLLLRHQSGELNCEIPLIISNHENLRPVADYFGIDYQVIKITSETKEKGEKRELELLKSYQIDFITLARYMQILTEKIIAQYPHKIINIHHSFLPAFKGANPYKRAHQRGVKVIGATAHFVTVDLDQGPIISQDVVPVSHKESVKELIIKGRDVERLVLREAVKLFIDNRIFVHDNRTFIL
jgi:formyltetrahydrofolate deformylase